MKGVRHITKTKNLTHTHTKSEKSNYTSQVLSNLIILKLEYNKLPDLRLVVSVLTPFPVTLEKRPRENSLILYFVNYHFPFFFFL